MGLDMYLRGRKYLGWTDATKRVEDGLNVSHIEVELGYWRKHPNLHGFIVQNFAGGVDECQEIDLDVERLSQIIDAVEKKVLPHTTGFFFGRSDGSKEEAEEDLKILRAAKEWLAVQDAGVIRAVHYRASW